ncbi:Gfo/Idh/MocA family protein [Carboxylicivirga marina]|uniref:Gfo/Idh/MocA family oxidoreductase n=1 Tax=Carboxylicivirga marina TaxID=2800988 RepID=A0ABS1HQ82_9BACT|nr:Gfo/Idh/MocA family oxidoreductase [Carboxylicivirga marina]MBK3519849.1 Gfo/Idh/MocA family oxidoreductase [Carboxylicivirga marina]
MKYTRRDFINKSLLAGSLTLTASTVSCLQNEVKSDSSLQAPDGPKLKAGLIGCGSRGTGAVLNFLDSGPSLEIVALGDIFEDKLQKCRDNIKKERNIELDYERCFVGPDAFEKVIDCDIDIVLLATPPYFRPQHFEAAIKAGKHVFMEKPVAVDPVGVRSILINGIRAQEMGLSVVTGTIKRHQEDYKATYKKIQQGAIGEITSGNCYYNQGKLWHVNPKAEWSELEAMVRNWVNWTWLSGDHIVEQHIHNLDLMNWYIGSHPIKATGFGSRQRRVTGDQFDNFSVDYIYPNNVHVHSMCRQINGCSTNVSDYIRGTHGYTNCENTIFNPQGQVRWKYPLNDEQSNDRWYFFWRAFVQEHVDLVTAIRNNQPINEAQQIAESSLTAIMGRISAYTGKTITWDEMLNSEIHLGPKHFIMGNTSFNKSIPTPGK